MSNVYGTRAMTVTLLTVCVDALSLTHLLDVAEYRNWAVEQASFDGYISARRRPHFGENLKSTDGCVAIVDFDQDPVQAVEATAYLQQAFAGKIVVVAFSASKEPGPMLLAMRAGCTEFLTKPLDEAMFDAACMRFEQQFSSRGAKLSASGTVVAFIGGKGGVGTTTLAVHLADYLVHNNKKRVLLIDSHAQFGHACIYLGVDGSGFHFQEIVRNVNRLDSELLGGFIAKHPSGLHVLSSPDVGQEAQTMNPEDIAGTLDFLRSEYDYVVVDCPRLLHENNLAVIAAASQVYVVATPEISAIRDLSRYVDDLVHIDNLTNKVKVVLNRYSSQFAVSTEYIEKAIRLPVSFCIPNSYVELVRSSNMGVPVPVTAKSVFSEELRKWADALVGVNEPVAQPARKESQAGLFSFLNGKINLRIGGGKKPAKAAAAKTAGLSGFPAEREA